MAYQPPKPFCPLAVPRFCQNSQQISLTLKEPAPSVRIPRWSPATLREEQTSEEVAA